VDECAGSNVPIPSGKRTCGAANSGAQSAAQGSLLLREEGPPRSDVREVAASTTRRDRSLEGVLARCTCCRSRWEAPDPMTHRRLRRCERDLATVAVIPRGASGRHVGGAPGEGVRSERPRGRTRGTLRGLHRRDSTSLGSREHGGGGSGGVWDGKRTRVLSARQGGESHPVENAKRPSSTEGASGRTKSALFTKGGPDATSAPRCLAPQDAGKEQRRATDAPEVRSQPG
jgi:hypothetical protein